jgi:hypothetical protein
LTEIANKVNIIRPVDPDNVDIQKDPFHPMAYVISLPLDAEPSYVWLTLFQQELWSSLDFWDRKVVITGKALKLVTAPDNVKDKLHWLEQLVVATNKRVEDHNRQARAQKDAGRTKLLDEEAIRKDVSTWQLGGVRT